MMMSQNNNEFLSTFLFPHNPLGKGFQRPKIFFYDLPKRIQIYVIIGTTKDVSEAIAMKSVSRALSHLEESGAKPR